MNFHSVGDAERALDTLNYSAIKVGAPVRLSAQVQRVHMGQGRQHGAVVKWNGQREVNGQWAHQQLLLLKTQLLLGSLGPTCGENGLRLKGPAC